MLSKAAQSPGRAARFKMRDGSVRKMTPMTALHGFSELLTHNGAEPLSKAAETLRDAVAVDKSLLGAFELFEMLEEQ
jgi:hypothetical protein